ncbi:acylneuraminate cytidylyltransferase family protein [bacterium]|nr:acylneuraminate cytidylyltransferase family protein [bacterium]
MKLLGIIPARGGSKGIPRKNIICLAGKPLIAYTIEAALGAEGLSDLTVSTDCPVIRQSAEALGISVIQRPAVFAGDKAPTIQAIRHALKAMEMEKRISYGGIVILQPTSPLRDSSHITQSIQLFENQQPECESVISCYDASAYHPDIMYRKDGGCLMPYAEKNNRPKRRQEFEKVYIRNGAIYIATRRLVTERGMLYSTSPCLFEMRAEHSVNIDSVSDLDLAEYYLGKKERS